MCALALHMITPSTPRVGAIAAVSFFAITGCTPASLGVLPETVLATVIARSSVVHDDSHELRPHHAASPTNSGLASAVVRGDARAPHGGLLLRRQVRVGRQHTARRLRLLRGSRNTYSRNTASRCRERRASRCAPVRASPPTSARLRPGDLMFFAEPGEAISQVAIYAGDGIILTRGTRARLGASRRYHRSVDQFNGGANGS